MKIRLRKVYLHVVDFVQATGTEQGRKVVPVISSPPTSYYRSFCSPDKIGARLLFWNKLLEELAEYCVAQVSFAKEVIKSESSALSYISG